MQFSPLDLATGINSSTDKGALCMECHLQWQLDPLESLSKWKTQISLKSRREKFKVLESHHATMSFSQHLSELFTEFCHHNEVNTMTFSKLTQAKNLPEISADVASI